MVRVLVFDSYLAAKDAQTNDVELLDDSGGEPDDHCVRGLTAFAASLMSAGFDRKRVHVAFMSYRGLFADARVGGTQDTGRMYRPHVTIHPYSVREDQDIFQGLRRFFTEMSTMSLQVTSPGHEPGLVRFPGSLEDGLTVGVSDRTGRLLSYCGREESKPELLVDQEYLASLHGLGGTSGACYVAGALAAIVAGASQRIGPGGTRASVLSMAAGRPVTGLRSDFFGRVRSLSVLRCTTGRRKLHVLRASPRSGDSGTLCICPFARYFPSRWMRDRTTIIVASRTRTVASETAEFPSHAVLRVVEDTLIKVALPHAYPTDILYFAAENCRIEILRPGCDPDARLYSHTELAAK